MGYHYGRLLTFSGNIYLWKKDKKAKIDVDDSKIMSNRHRSVSEAQLMTKYQEVILLQQEKIKELEFKVNTYIISSIY